MRAGKLRHRVTIEQRATTQDAAGQQSTTWSTFATVYAGIEPLTGRELQAAMAVANPLTHRVTIRYYSGVAAAMRVKHGSRYLNIVAVRNVEERNRTLELDCVEGLRDG